MNLKSIFAVFFALTVALVGTQATAIACGGGDMSGDKAEYSAPAE